MVANRTVFGEVRNRGRTQLKKTLGKGTVVAPDGSRAFHGAAAAADRPVLKGVNHMMKVFTPASKLLKSKLDAKTTRMLRARAKGKQPCVKETACFFILSAGDNSVDGAHRPFEEYNAQAWKRRAHRFAGHLQEKRSGHGGGSSAPPGWLEHSFAGAQIVQDCSVER